MIINKWWLIIACNLLVLVSISQAQVSSDVALSSSSKKFYAVGPGEPVVEYLREPSSPVPRQLHKVAVEVHFDLVPTMMRFSMPCYPCMVTENGIHYSNGWTETYDPKASSSCEAVSSGYQVVKDL